MTRSPRRLREHVKDTVSDLPIHAARLAVMGVGRALLLTDRVRKDYRDVRESGLGPVLGRLKTDAGNITGMVVDKVSGNGKTKEEPKNRTAGDSEISVGKPKPAASSRPASSQRPATPPKPATAPPSRPADVSRPKPATASKPAAAKPASKPAASKPATSKAKPAAKPKPAAQEKTSPPAKPAAKPETKAKAAEAKSATSAEPSSQAKADKQAKASAPAKPAVKKPAAKAKSATAKDLPVSDYDEATLASVRARLRGLDTKQVTELRDYERSHAARADFLRMYENRIAKLRSER
jgi:hypothetical protein